MLNTVRVAELFESIQGESTYAGLSCFFIRLSGCNLDCSYCDTPIARETGEETGIDTLLERAAASRASIVQVTGGEPLLQEGFPKLITSLSESTLRPILVETNGSLDISCIPPAVTAIVDVKAPGSGEAHSFDDANLQRLRTQDEVKIILSDRADYEWARDFVEEHELVSRCNAVLFGAAEGRLSAQELSRWIVEDGSGVMLQVQLHKLLGVK